MSNQPRQQTKTQGLDFSARLRRMGDAAQSVEGVLGHLPHQPVVEIDMTDRNVPCLPLPSQEYLCDVFQFQPSTGKLFYKTSRRGAGYAGFEAGTRVKRPGGKGFIRVRLDWNNYRAHHIIWKMVYGEDPTTRIQHINRDPFDNRLENLRLWIKEDEPVRNHVTKKVLPSQEVLKAALHYDPATGKLTWKISSGNAMPGKEAGSELPKGYRNINIGKVSYFVHRVIWKWMTGEDPHGEIDHIDQNPRNNAWSNLRDVERHINGKNCKLFSTNTSGVCGVNWNEQNQRWVAVLGHHNDKVRKGSFKNFEDAVAARKAAEAELGYTELHGQDKG